MRTIFAPTQIHFLAHDSAVETFSDIPQDRSLNVNAPIILRKSSLNKQDQISVIYGKI